MVKMSISLVVKVLVLFCLYVYVKYILVCRYICFCICIYICCFVVNKYFIWDLENGVNIVYIRMIVVFLKSDYRIILVCVY